MQSDRETNVEKKCSVIQLLFSQIGQKNISKRLEFLEFCARETKAQR